MHTINFSKFKTVNSDNVQQYGILKFALYLLLTINFVSAFNYCSLCSKHVACTYRKKMYSQTCSNLNLDASQKEDIVKLHNEMRNQIAMGQITKFSKAAKMSSLHWDDELAYLAGINAHSCNYGHDVCRATKKYPYAGQNIAQRGNNQGYEKMSTFIRDMITTWFNEYKDADMSNINSYPTHHRKEIGHFTAMMTDKNNAIGCAIVKYLRGVYHYHYLVCNYGYTNVYGRPIYEKSSSTGSKCKIRDPVYEGLCSTNEAVGYNKI